MNNHFQSMSHEFAHYLTKASAVEFLGIARLLHVKLTDDDNVPIPADQLVLNVLAAYSDLPRKRKRELLRALRDSIAAAH